LPNSRGVAERLSISAMVGLPSQAKGGARQADLGEAGAQPMLAGDNDARPAVQLCSA